MIRIPLLIVLAVFASLTIEPLLGPFLPAVPMIPLIAVVLVAAVGGPLQGVLAGSFAGLCLDILGADAVGINLGSMAVLGFSVGSIIRLLPPWPFVVRVTVSGALIFLYFPMTIVFSRLSGASLPFDLSTLIHFSMANLFCAMLGAIFIRQRA